VRVKTGGRRKYLGATKKGRVSGSKKMAYGTWIPTAKGWTHTSTLTRQLDEDPQSDERGRVEKRKFQTPLRMKRRKRYSSGVKAKACAFISTSLGRVKARKLGQKRTMQQESRLGRRSPVRKKCKDEPE